LTIFCKWCTFCLSCRRDSFLEGRGAEGASPEESGRNSQAKGLQLHAILESAGPLYEDLDTDGETPGLPQGIISQVKRQEEGDGINVAFLLFILCRGVPRQGVSTRLKE
jgi:hypothetical protein